MDGRAVCAGMEWERMRTAVVTAVTAAFFCFRERGVWYEAGM